MSGATLADFLTTDTSAAFCKEATNEAIVDETLVHRVESSNGCEDGDSSKSGCDDDHGTPPVTTQITVQSIESLISYIHSTGLPPAYVQQLELMCIAIVKQRLLHKQMEIADFFKPVPK